LRTLAPEIEELSEARASNRNAALALALVPGTPVEEDTLFREVASVHEARRLEEALDGSAAVAAWRDAMHETTHPALRSTIAYEAARWQADHGDPALVIDLCHEVIQPPLMSWNWASTVLPCLEWSARAHDRLGNSAAAASIRTTHRQLRDAARSALESSSTSR
jgi:hypothetical protein